MISEGEPGVDEVFSLTEGELAVRGTIFNLTGSDAGVLSLDLSKEVYERAGLQGTPVSSGGRKHVKSRYRESTVHPLPFIPLGRGIFSHTNVYHRRHEMRSSHWKAS